MRSSYFSGFDFNASATTAFDTQVERDLIFDPLLIGIVGSNLTTQPSDGDIKTELNELTVKLTSCGGSCSSDRTEVVVKAVCAAMLGSAAMLVQ